MFFFASSAGITARASYRVLDMPGLKFLHFLGPGPAVIRHDEEILEGLIGHLREDGVELLRGNNTGYTFLAFGFSMPLIGLNLSPALRTAQLNPR